jgi:hypothetical protein
MQKIQQQAPAPQNHAHLRQGAHSTENSFYLRDTATTAYSLENGLNGQHTDNQDKK